MRVLEFLNYYANLGQDALAKLTEEYSIKVSNNIKYPDLYVLNYDQINSPKLHPTVKECRSLVVSIDIKDGEFYVVSRSFDRFLNYGESGNTPEINEDTIVYEKMDGSLISVFWYEDEWLYRTKSMIMPEGAINNWDVTWKERIEEALGDTFTKDYHDINCTYIGELICRENRVVVKYNTEPTFTLLSVRNNNGKYVSFDFLNWKAGISFLGMKWKLPRQYKFKSIEHCIDKTKSLPNLEEGFVIYNNYGTPICKVKSPAYLAAHRLKGEGLNPKRIMELILMGEEEEYMAVFPEDERFFIPYLKTYGSILENISGDHFKYLAIKDQKEFAIEVKGLYYSSTLFQARARGKGINPLDIWKEQKDSYKFKVFKNTLKGERDE